MEVVLFYEDWGPAATDIWEKTGVPVVGINPFYPEEELAGPRKTGNLQQAMGLDGKGGGL